MVMSILCPECGLQHPPVVPGTCPMAKAKEVEEIAKQESGTRVVNLSIDIQKEYLNKSKTLATDPEKITMGQKILEFVKNM